MLILDESLDRTSVPGQYEC